MGDFSFTRNLKGLGAYGSIVKAIGRSELLSRFCAFTLGKFRNVLQHLENRRV